MWNWIKNLFKKSKDAPVITQLPPKPMPGKTWGPTESVKPEIPSLGQIAKDLQNEADKWVGVREHGYNDGPEVNMFQKFVDGKARDESWCMCFGQYVAGQVCKKYGIKTPLYPSEHCNTVYNNTPEKYKSQKWTSGFMFIQKAVTSSDGHTGYCDDTYEMAYEGNTNAKGHADGDGVLYRWRSVKGSVEKPMRGYINLPLMIQDAIVRARVQS